MARRVAAIQDAAKCSRMAALADAYDASLERAIFLKNMQGILDWDAGSTLSTQSQMAIDTLSLGLCRCLTLSYSGSGWDTHTDNDNDQSSNFEGLFSGLLSLMSELQVTPGTGGGTLLDETVVVVLSEMGRTPQLNDADGKDHWPYTSMLVSGPGVAGGQVIGGYDRYYYGQPVDPDTGEIDEDSGLDLSVSSVGATLLNLADIDHEPFLPGVLPIPGLLS